MAELVTKRYATALFESAKENNTIDVFQEEVLALQKIIKNEPEFLEILNHHEVLQEEKIALIEKVFEGKISREILGLLVLIVEKGRQEYLLDILDTFIEMVKAHKGIIKAIVTSSIPLSKEQIAQIRTNLAVSTQAEIEMEICVDESLIGGLILQVGDRVVDGSILGKMQTLKQQLSNVRLA